MHRSIARTAALALALAAGAACSDGYVSDPGPVDPAPVPTTLSATGDVAARLEEFRSLLGWPSNGGTAGEQAAGRREISWDGAAANAFNNRNDFPASFFNTNVASGAVFATPAYITKMRCEK